MRNPIRHVFCATPDTTAKKGPRFQNHAPVALTQLQKATRTCCSAARVGLGTTVPFQMGKILLWSTFAKRDFIARPGNQPPCFDVLRGIIAELALRNRYLVHRESFNRFRTQHRRHSAKHVHPDMFALQLVQSGQKHARVGIIVELARAYQLRALPGLTVPFREKAPATLATTARMGLLAHSKAVPQRVRSVSQVSSAWKATVFQRRQWTARMELLSRTARLMERPVVSAMLAMFATREVRPRRKVVFAQLIRFARQVPLVLLSTALPGSIKSLLAKQNAKSVWRVTFVLRLTWRASTVL